MLKPGIPTEAIDKPSAWQGKAMSAQPELWLKLLTQRQIHELEAAAEHYLKLEIDIGEITAEAFPLPEFSKDLKQLQNTLLKKHGFQVYRGLPVENYSIKETATIFCGIGAHLGSARSQNAKGDILGHVKDTNADHRDPNTRIYQTAQRQSFHTDSADVVGLLCLQQAKTGGESLLVSAETIFNRMLDTDPHLLSVLFEPIATDRRGEVPEGEQPFMTIPVFSWLEDHLTVFYQRQYIESSQRLKNAPRLSDLQTKALNRLDELANDPELHLSMQLEKGDMQFVYNHSQLHDRMGFEDFSAPEKRRHLFRLWLSMQNDRVLPESFRQRYGSIEPGNRGGIITKDTKLRLSLNA